jgi:hypothetical protein
MPLDAETWLATTWVPHQHDLLRRHIEQLWQEQPVLSVGVDDFRPAYQVPGRRRNGSVTGEHPIRWLGGRILLPVRNVLMNLIGLAMANPPGPGFRRSRVKGHANCMALSLADATRHEHQRLEVEPLWLMWSRSRAALLRVRTEPEFHLEWVWEGQARPEAPTTLRFPDGSAVVFHLEPLEAKRFAENLDAAGPAQ